MTAFSAAFPSSVIKSIQYGTGGMGEGDPAVGATITAVVVAKSVCIHNGQSTTAGGDPGNGNSGDRQQARVALTSTTNVQCTRGGGNNYGGNTVGFVVVEYY